ncbi:hypothetical protein BT69DRAFT_1297588 [Atractiella rhizophila]|nr:hypothetical protein BT69DRAFT_1297588 [Atractiella rhizophila]
MLRLIPFCMIQNTVRNFKHIFVEKVEDRSVQDQGFSLSTGPKGIGGVYFVSSTVGWMEDVGVGMEYGKNYEGYWDAAKPIAQFVPVFEKYHPGDQALIMFDNSTGHGAFAADALVATRMNLGPGGANAFCEMKIVFEEGHPKAGQAKVILSERGQWPVGGLKARCKKKAEHNEDGTCCAEKLMALQPDFNLRSVGWLRLSKQQDTLLSSYLTSCQSRYSINVQQEKNFSHANLYVAKTIWPPLQNQCFDIQTASLEQLKGYINQLLANMLQNEVTRLKEDMVFKMEYESKRVHSQAISCQGRRKGV